jgi:CheY-like chemotaxis protein
MGSDPFGWQPSHSLVKALIVLSEGALLKIDSSGRIAAASASACDLFHRSLDHLIGHPVAEVFSVLASAENSTTPDCFPDLLRAAEAPQGGSLLLYSRPRMDSFVEGCLMKVCVASIGEENEGILLQLKPAAHSTAPEKLAYEGMEPLHTFNNQLASVLGHISLLQHQACLPAHAEERLNMARLAAQDAQSTCARILAMQTFPPESLKQASRPAATPLPLPPEHKVGRILILEDEAMLRELMRITLEMIGFEVEEASTGEKALSAYTCALQSKRPFSLLICDLTLPGRRTGVQTVAEIRAIDPTLRALLCTGNTSHPAFARFHELGFQAVLAKPYEVAELERVVREVVALA